MSLGVEARVFISMKTKFVLRFKKGAAMLQWTSDKVFGQNVEVPLLYLISQVLRMIFRK